MERVFYFLWRCFMVVLGLGAMALAIRTMDGIIACAGVVALVMGIFGDE